MQTSFTAEQLRDPEVAASNQVIRTCVHCGMCTATCPTFVLLGDELDSPRGRIYLIKDMLEQGRAAGDEEALHIDRCLSCLSCMTTCPSGVYYMHLIDHARAHVERTYRRPWHDRLLRAALAAILPRPSLMRASLAAARLAAPLKALLPGGVPGQRLRAMLDLAAATRKVVTQAGLPAVTRSSAQPARGRVALLTGCAQTVLAPSINAATARLISRMGYDVLVAPNVPCCGALTHHLGRHDAAMASARAAIEGWTRLIVDGGLDAIVINTSGCGTTVKDYGFMFREEPEPWRSQAARVASLAVDVSEFLTRATYTAMRPPPGLTVAYHSACSLQHGQGVSDAPKALLRAAGFTVVEPAEGHLCCGSAGTYNLLQPEIAQRLRARKLANIAAKTPDLIAAGNIGCLTQLAGGGLPTIHTVELLDWMAGGPEPAGLDPSGPEPAGLDLSRPEPAGLDPSGPEPAGLDLGGPEPAGLDPSGPEPAGLDLPATRKSAA